MLGENYSDNPKVYEQFWTHWTKLYIHTWGLVSGAEWSCMAVSSAKAAQVTDDT